MTFQRGLLPRSTRDQAVVTGATTSLSYALAIAMQSATEGVAARVARGSRADGEQLRRRVVLAADLGAAAVGAAGSVLLRERPNEHVARSTLRTLSRVLATTATAGAVVTTVEEVIDRRDGVEDGVRFPVALPIGAVVAGGVYYLVKRREARAITEADSNETVESAELSARRAVVMAGGVAAGLGTIAIVERTAATGVAAALQWAVGADASLARPVGHAASLAGLLTAGVVAYDRALAAQEKGADAVEAAYNAPPASDTVSGGPRSLVAWEPLSREGRRFVGMALTPDEITSVMDEPAMAPLRLYAGLESAPDGGSRVDLLLDELLHMEAYERSTICVFVPTGSGYVNYVAAESVEYLTRGDVASICLQYSKLPSFMSLDRVGLGRFQVRDLLRAVSSRIATMPPDARPRLLLFGESLGAHVSQDAFLHQGIRGLESFGIDAAVWLGTPHASRWRHQVRAAQPMPDQVVEVASPAEFGALEPARQEAVRYLLLTHHEDPIPKFTPRLIVQQPDWLGPASTRESGVPAETVWTPMGTFLSVGVDLLNAMNIKPGAFRAFAHDYRSSIRPMVQQVFRMSADQEQTERIDQALREREARWARERVVADELARANEAIRKKIEEFGDAVGVGAAR
jgi:uncharacterized membrane protein